MSAPAIPRGSPPVEARGPTVFDHVALGCRDVEAGARWLSDATGAEVRLTEPEPGQWYRSAALDLDGGQMVEIIGPAPDHRGFHPIKALLRRYARPAPLFWHLATPDIEGFGAVAAAAGAPLERIERVRSSTPHGERHYVRAICGPGFRSVRPCVIQWLARPRAPGADAGPLCRAARFALRAPDPTPLDRLFEALGLPLRAEAGPQRLALELETPAGPVELAGPGVVLEGAGAALRLLELRLRHALSGLGPSTPAGARSGA